mgnify:FL=1
MIDALATWPHYQAHVLPVFAALSEENRGTFYVGTDEQLILTAKARGVEADLGYPRGVGGLVIVAGHTDMAQCPDRHFIFVEHGSGQAYAGVDSPSYSGGSMRPRVALFLTLNETTATRERAANPDVPVEIVGSPRLDELTEHAYDRRGPSRSSTPPVVAFCWHAHIKIAPETRATYPYWFPAVRRLHESGAYRVLGHGHPREWRKLRGWYEKVGIEAVEDFADVVAQADLVCVDNSSTGPEFAAATGRPVLWLDAPAYRREVEHGGRFWDWPTGQVSCDEPERLPQRIALALADTHEAANARQVMVDTIYPPWARGRAAELAVEAIRRRDQEARPDG